MKPVQNQLPVSILAMLSGADLANRRATCVLPMFLSRVRFDVWWGPSSNKEGEHEVDMSARSRKGGHPRHHSARPAVPSNSSNLHTTRPEQAPETSLTTTSTDTD